MRRKLLLFAACLLALTGGQACENPPSVSGTAYAEDARTTEGDDSEQARSAEPTKAEPATSVEIRHRMVASTEDEPTAQVGVEAPDFTLTAYHQGAFKQVTLSDYRGHWVLLCFYPGDFTFV